MEDMKKVLAHWDSCKSEFDAKLVAREETGCCLSAAGAENEMGCKN